MSKTRKIVLGVVGGVLVVLGGGYAASYFIAGNQVPAKAAVDGVAIGGLSPEKAAEKLRAELGPKVDQDITLSAGDHSVTLKPADAGLTADYEATVAAAGGGFSWNPMDIVHSLTGGGSVDLVRDVDTDKLRSAVEADAPAFAVQATDASVGFEEGKVVQTPGVEAQTLNVDKSVDGVATAFKEGKGHVEAALDTTAPAVTDEMAKQAAESFAEPLVSGPVKLTHNDTSMEITPAQLAEAATFTKDGDKLVGSLDAEKLFTSTAEAQKGLKVKAAKDASFTFTNGAVTVVPAVEGESLDKASFVAAVERAALATGEGRTAPVEVTTQEPTYTTQKATALGAFTKIGSFTTNFPHAPYRNQNLGRAAELVNGSVLMPGATFSLNDALGERNAANGFTDGYVINGGRLVKEPGGGISQAATTLFNASFFAGYKDIEHKPHSLYFPRYPAGRESTIYYGSLDMRFQNDTEFPAIIRGYIDKSAPGKQGSITFEIWSKPTYEKIVSTDIVKSGYYSGGTRTVKGDPKCEPQAPIQGFTASWKRIFYQGGKVVKEEPYSWKYDAGDRIVCE